MSGNVTFLELINAAKDRADMVGSTLVGDPQWKEYINKSKDVLYSKLISAYDSDYYAKTSNISIVSNTDTYALPSDFFKLLSLEEKVSENQYRNIHKFNFRTKNNYEYPSYRSGYRNYVMYRLVGSNLVFHPVPTSNATIRMWYYPLTRPTL